MTSLYPSALRASTVSVLSQSTFMKSQKWLSAAAFVEEAAVSWDFEGEMRHSTKMNRWLKHIICSPFVLLSLKMYEEVNQKMTKKVPNNEGYGQYDNTAVAPSL